MVTVTMLKERGLLVGFSATGHANFKRSGEDIVCSAISALTQAAALGLQKRAQVAVSIDEHEGMHCVLGQDCTTEQCHEADVILDTMLLGLQAIQNEYKGYLKLREREV